MLSLAITQLLFLPSEAIGQKHVDDSFIFGVAIFN